MVRQGANRRSSACLIWVNNPAWCYQRESFSFWKPSRCGRGFHKFVSLLGLGCVRNAPFFFAVRRFLIYPEAVLTLCETA